MPDSRSKNQLKHGPPPLVATAREANLHRLRTTEGRALYKRRGATVEPGIANLNKIMHRFARRGIDDVASELHLAATLSIPRRAKQSMIFFRLAMPGSTVAPRRL